MTQATIRKLVVDSIAVTLEEAVNITQRLMDQDLALSSVRLATRNQCPKANNNANGRAHMLRDKNAHQHQNVVTGMFLLNQHLAKVLFDSGDDKSFVSISHTSMLNILQITLDTAYDIEMANGNLYHAKIPCDEKVVHIPIDGEISRTFNTPCLASATMLKYWGVTTLVNETAEKQGRFTDEDMFGFNNLDGDEVIVDNVDVVKASKETVNAAATTIPVSTASTIPVSAATITDVEITLAQALTELKSAKPKVDKVVVQEPE
ncbi:hypothetical protein Tco_1137563 [Tanacetum coccineum]